MEPSSKWRDSASRLRSSRTVGALVGLAALLLAILWFELIGGDWHADRSPVEFAYVADPSRELDAEAALALLRKRGERSDALTGRGGSIHWLLLSAPRRTPSGSPRALVLSGNQIGDATVFALDAANRTAWRASVDEATAADRGLHRIFGGIVLEAGPAAAPASRILVRVGLLADSEVRVLESDAATIMLETADFERHVGAAIATLALLVVGCALYALLQRSRRLAAFAGWAASMSLCAATSGWDLALLSGLMPAAWVAKLRLAVYCIHLATTTWLLLTLFGRDLASPRLRRAIRLVPPAGVVASLAILAFLPGFPPALPYAAGLVAVIVSLAALHRLASTHAAQLSIFLAGWAAHVGGAMRESLLPTKAGEALGWLSAGSGAVAFSACAGVIVAWMLHTEARQRDRAERNALDAARKYRHVYYSVPVALVSVDPLGHVLRWNDQAAQLFRNELRQGRLNTLSGVLGAERAASLIAEVTSVGRHRSEIEVQLAEADGGRRTCAIDALQSADAIEITLVDVTERSLFARTLEHMAHHDALTDRLNRRGLEREIERLTKLVAHGAQASLVLVNLDRFKAINDVFGHAAGDSVVVEVAQRIAAVLPASAQVGRLGGDEFLAALPDCALDQARPIAHRLVAHVIDEPYEIDGKRIRVDASVGIVEVAPGMQVRELIAYADAACTEAKKGRGGRIVAAESSKEHLARYRAEIALGAQLRSSLPTERMSVHAQPIVALKGDPGVMSYEVLLRERDERGQIMPPTRLITAAERHGAMSAIDRFMLERTLQHLDQNRRHADALGFVTVNLSGISLNDERFLADAHAMLAQHSAVATRICLEITESVALYDMRNTRRFVDRMHSLGVRIALDDFGAGYSSFAYLRELSAALVKIDGQFTLAIDRQPKNQVIVRGIHRLASDLGMACLAEWVENVAELETLLALDIDFAQGFVFSKAQPLETWLSQAVNLQPLEQARRPGAAAKGAAASTTGRDGSQPLPADGRSKAHNPDRAERAPAVPT